MHQFIQRYFYRENLQNYNCKKKQQKIKSIYQEMKNQTEDSFFGSISNGFLSENTPGRSVILDSRQFQVKKLFQFISLMPEVQNAIFLIYPGQHCIPKSFLKMYPINETFHDYFELYLSQITLQKNKQTLLIGLDISYLNLTQKDSISSEKHLILLYLLRKINNKKFVICLDDSSMKCSSFDNIKATFIRMASFLPQQEITDCFMMLVTHSLSQNQIKKLSQNELSKSLKEPIGFYLHRNFTQNILENILSKKRAYYITREVENEQIQIKKKEFQKLIKQLSNYKHDSNNQFQINSIYMNFLYDKSKEFTYKLDNKIMGKLQGKPEGPFQNEGISKLFNIWDEFFNMFINYIIQKIKRGKNDYGSRIKSQQKFMISKQCPKYVIDNLLKTKKNNEQQTCRSFTTTRLFARVLQFYIKNAQKYEKIKANTSVSEKLRSYYLQQSLKQFIQLFYECEILNPNMQEKIMYDYFMIFQQLSRVWGNIEMTTNDKIKVPFFLQSDLMSKFICNMQIVSNTLIPVLQKMCNYQIQSDLNMIKNGHYVILQLLEQPINKIKLALQRSQAKKYTNQRLQKTILEVSHILCSKRLKHLSRNPLQKLKLLIETLQKSVDDSKYNELLSILGKTLNQYTKQYRLERVEHKKAQELTLKLLKFDEFRSIDEICSIYENQLQLILVPKRNDSPSLLKQQFTLQQLELIESYTDFLIKLGRIETARQIAYSLSFYSQQISKQILCKCLSIKDNIKQHISLIRLDNKVDRGTSKEQVQEVLQELKSIMQGDNQVNLKLEIKVKEEEQLIDL